MAGHSHWHSIRHKKALEDQKRGKIFSKLSRQIALAAREGGDPKMNPKLRMAIERAKEFNMPSENIEKAIKRGEGKLQGTQFEEVLYEGFGPGGIALIVEGITDNKNRSFHQIREIFTNFGGKLAKSGAVKWLFEKKGSILINKENLPNLKKEELELISIEAGAEDLRWQDNFLEIYTKIENLEKVKNNLKEKGIKIEGFSLDWVPKEEILLSQKEREKCEKLFEALDELDFVQEIYSNLKKS